MLRHNALRMALVGASMTAVAAFGTGTASAATTTVDATSCHVAGYVCIVPASSPDEGLLIPEGQSYTASPGVDILSISNDTAYTICVNGDYNFGLAPSAERDVEYNLTGFGPNFGGSGCLS
ncbi:hypothetical protein ACFCWG_12705 [Streptomyces sp. NPDC056390]|uniref:hypothetical protein n=1 Tax=Streptomyces sp. NPDC056390 TaxID=3345806 RepID=UPI0035D81F9C